MPKEAWFQERMDKLNNLSKEVDFLLVTIESLDNYDNPFQARNMLDAIESLHKASNEIRYCTLYLSRLSKGN